jgi:hypothetical protein
MNNTTLRLKIVQRLNKLASNDYDNIDCWQVVEAFNKALIEWSRRQIRGSNPYMDGSEKSVIRVDDLQKLLKPEDMPMVPNELFVESLNPIPTDYLKFKRISCYAKSKCCSDKRLMVVYLVEEDNRDILLRDEHKKPSFEWGETFATLINNKIRVYTNSEFEIDKIELTYYRKPRRIQIAGCQDPYTGVVSAADVECEFDDDIIEILIDEAVSILAGDIESFNQYQRGTQSAERNN